MLTNLRRRVGIRTKKQVKNTIVWINPSHKFFNPFKLKFKQRYETFTQNTQSHKSMLLIAIMFAASQSNGQIKPSDSGYAPVNGIKVYYEVYGEGKPIVLLHGAFMTIGMNWGELIT